MRASVVLFALAFVVAGSCGTMRAEEFVAASGAFRRRWRPRRAASPMSPPSPRACACPYPRSEGRKERHGLAVKASSTPARRGQRRRGRRRARRRRGNSASCRAASDSARDGEDAWVVHGPEARSLQPVEQPGAKSVLLHLLPGSADQRRLHRCRSMRPMRGSDSINAMRRFDIGAVVAPANAPQVR